MVLVRVPVFDFLNFLSDLDALLTASLKAIAVAFYREHLDSMRQLIKQRVCQWLTHLRQDPGLGSRRSVAVGQESEVTHFNILKRVDMHRTFSGIVDETCST